MNVADAVAAFLVDKGCTHAFGIVGSANLPLFEAISRKLTVVSVHHEQAAAMAATYFYRIKGVIAPVLVTAGAGSINAFTGVMAAQFDSIPLLVLSGNEKSSFFGPPHCRTIGFQGFETQDAVRGFTKYAHRAKDAQSAMFSLRDAWFAAMKPRRGAAWLDIPQDIAREMVK
jgi:acetolactate synthase-1/2/3 large subunit